MDHGGVVVAPAMDVEVLVHAETPEVEGSAVDEESRALDPHRANADSERVAVDDDVDVDVDQLDLELVQVTTSGSPELWCLHPDSPPAPVASATTAPSASLSRTRTVAASAPAAAVDTDHTVPPSMSVTTVTSAK